MKLEEALIGIRRILNDCFSCGIYVDPHKHKIILDHDLFDEYLKSLPGDCKIRAATKEGLGHPILNGFVVEKPGWPMKQIVPWKFEYVEEGIPWELIRIVE